MFKKVLQKAGLKKVFVYITDSSKLQRKHSGTLKDVVKSVVKSVLHIGSAHNKEGSADLNIAQISLVLKFF